jgi:hypothetical protein
LACLLRRQQKAIRNHNYYICTNDYLDINLGLGVCLSEFFETDLPVLKVRVLISLFVILSDLAITETHDIYTATVVNGVFLRTMTHLMIIGPVFLVLLATSALLVAPMLCYKAVSVDCPLLQALALVLQLQMVWLY